jgi:uncharacterized protein YfaT (DUF1175 family)
MINYIASETSRLFVVNNGGTPFYHNGNLPSSGLVRYVANTSNLESYDGSSWVPISKSVSISLSPDTLLTIEWAEKQRLREEKIKKLIADNPTIMDLHNSMELAKEKLDVAVALLYSEDKTHV